LKLTLANLTTKLTKQHVAKVFRKQSYFVQHTYISSQQFWPSNIDDKQLLASVIYVKLDATNKSQTEIKTCNFEMELV